MSHGRASSLLKDPYSVIRRPVLTEKSHRGLPASQESGKEDRARYTFEVHVKANKSQIRKAIEKAFDVKVETVNTFIIKPKAKSFRMMGRGGQGFTRFKKRAVVRLAKGSKGIELI
ncbi:MAG: 50S ribosomal protein L23 [Planctomycetota bacterium]|nr:50S ribosomal protein L23 [Planctomycetota bacterium]